MVAGAVKWAFIVCTAVLGLACFGARDQCRCADVAARSGTQIEQLVPGVDGEEQTPKFTWTEKVIGEDELWNSCEKAARMDPILCREILARLNRRAHYYIYDDIRHGRPIKVPDDFADFRDWTPIPRFLPRFADIPRLILVVRSIPFLGWYEMGHMAGDTLACIGTKAEPTERGFYKVLEKDPDHYSRSYSNDFGEPAWMPWALRVYDTVWIHAGDVSSAYCSHGCVILPPKRAQDLYEWADKGTPVVIVDSVKDLDGTAPGKSGIRSR